MLRTLAALAPLLASCSSAPPAYAPAPEERTLVQRVPRSLVDLELVWVAPVGAWVGTTEVPWDAYLAWCAFDDPAVPGYDGVTRPSKPLEVHRFDHGFGVGAQPAIGMSRDAAAGFCAWLSEASGRTFRLPTEGEWRSAAGVGGDAVVAADRPRAVGAGAPNEHGLHDLVGNVWEYAAGPPGERAVLLGGSWRDAAASPRSRRLFDDAWTLDDPNFPPGRWWVPDGDHLGFRILCQAPPR